MSDLSHNPLDKIPAPPLSASDSGLPPRVPPLPATPPPVTVLAAALGISSTTLGAYRGARTTRVFSNPSSELTALLCNTGIYDLGWRGFLRCSGRDRVRWLNGMVTNSIKTLAENAGCYAFVLNAQGRIQGDLDIYRRMGDPEAFWLQIDHAQMGALTAFVRRYIIMDQVTIEPQEAWTAIGIAGLQTASTLAALGLSVAETPVQLTETSWSSHPIVVVSAFSPLVPRYEIWIEAKSALNLWNALTGSGAVPCGAQAVEHLRILEGTPAYGIDIADRDLPQETNQMRALNFTKGCYLGQEIVERIRSRGSVHRTFSGFLPHGKPPLPKTQLIAEGKAVGELTSVESVPIPNLGERVLALGFVRREVLDRKEALTADGEAVTPWGLPFDFAGAAVQP